MIPTAGKACSRTVVSGTAVTATVISLAQIQVQSPIVPIVQLTAPGTVISAPFVAARWVVNVAHTWLMLTRTGAMPRAPVIAAAVSII